MTRGDATCQHDPIEAAASAWKVSDRDSGTGMHVWELQHYMDDVVRPALDALVARRREIESDSVLAPPAALVPIELSILDDLEAVTVQTFALAIQAIWERQLRKYLQERARGEQLATDELRRRLAGLQRANWDQLRKEFEALCGVAIQIFGSFEELDLLQTLGNTCRHGDGVSSQALHRKWPELYVAPTATFLDWDDEASSEHEHPSVGSLSIPRRLLERLSEAVCWFWEDVGYLRLSRFKNKNRELENALKARQDRRAARPPLPSINAMRSS